MEAVRDRRAIVRTAAALLAALFAGGCGAMIPAAGHKRAQALVDAVARDQGAPSRPIGSDGDVTFGGFGFHYDAGADTLFMRVFVSPASVRKTTPQGLANFRKVAAALNDPAIGGMFDRAGGHFVLEESREAYFLVRAFPVPASEPATLADALERMQQVASLWTTRWFYRVAMIVGGHQPPPDRPVTLADPGPAE